VIGAGVIGLEMGSVWKRLGAEVTIWKPCRSSSAPPTTTSAKPPHASSRSRDWTFGLGAKLQAAEVKKGKST
jgi:dihydrolipoamide dehydrogenase